MLEIPEEIKEIYRKDNILTGSSKKLRLKFYDDSVDTLYPYETLWPADDLYPEEHEGDAFLIIENDRIVTESLNLTESLSSSEDMEFGSCESATFEIIVADVIEDLTGKEFTATIEVGGYEMAFGIYTVESFVRQADRRKRKITAYDRMRKFDTDVAGWYNELVFPMTVKQFRDSLCDYIGVPQSQQTLLFDELEITKTIEPEQISGRDILQAICQLNGCFGHFDKTGQLIYVMLQQTGLYPAEDLWPEETLYPSEFGGDGKPVEDVDYYKDLQYEDYLVEGITGLVIRQEEGDVGANVGTGENPYVVEGNFLLYGKTAVELLNIGESLLPYISGRVYKPARLECYAMPWLEVGDALRAQTRDDMVETFVMKRTMKGIQAMMDTIETTGAINREEVFGVNKKIIQLEGKTATIIVEVEEVSARVTNLKEETEAQFKITADQISAEVKAREEGDVELSGKIDVTSQKIDAEVTRATGEEEKLSGRITVEAGRITSEVTRATAAEGTLSSRITQTEKDITLKVSVGDVTKQLNSELKITGNSIALTTGHFTVDSTNLTVTSDGSLTCKNGNFTGTVTSSSIVGGSINIGSGTFTVSSVGKVKISSGEITMSGDSLSWSASNSSMTKNGTFSCTNGSFSGAITGGSININNVFTVTASGDTNISGDHFSWKAKNSSMTKDGTLTCSNGEFTGKITASSGQIGGFEIKDGNLISIKNSSPSINFGDMLSIDSSGIAFADNKVEITRNSILLDNIEINDEAIWIGYRGSDDIGRWETTTGEIYVEEVYPTSYTYFSDGLFERVDRLWDYVHGGGWNPCGEIDDCDGGGCEIECECEGSECGGGGCEIECDASDSECSGGGGGECSGCDSDKCDYCSGDDCEGAEGPGCV